MAVAAVLVQLRLEVFGEVISIQVLNVVRAQRLLAGCRVRVAARALPLQ